MIELPKDEVEFNDVGITFDYDQDCELHLANLWFKHRYVEVAVIRKQEDLDSLLGYGDKFKLCAKDADVMKVYDQWSCGGGEVEDFDPKPRAEELIKSIDKYVSAKLRAHSAPDPSAEHADKKVKEAKEELETLLNKLL